MNDKNFKKEGNVIISDDLTLPVEYVNVPAEPLVRLWRELRYLNQPHVSPAYITMERICSAKHSIHERGLAEIHYFVVIFIEVNCNTTVMSFLIN